MFVNKSNAVGCKMNGFSPEKIQVLLMERAVQKISIVEGSGKVVSGV